ncbi:MAG: hypothetical protein ACRDYX_21145 [Egibacteraceae bacterium]
MTDSLKDLQPTKPSDSSGSQEAVLGEVLEALPKEQRELLVQVVAQSHRGPLPPAEQFAMYEAACPGAGREILDGYRETRRHFAKMDRAVANTARLSLILTWLLILAVLGLAAYFGTTGQEWLAALFGIGGLVPVLLALLRGGGDWTGRRNAK